MKRLLLLPMIFFVLTLQAQNNNTNCPTIHYSQQSFCASQGTGNFYYRPAIKHLQATNGGAEILWFATATSNIPFDPEYILADGEVYFADNVEGKCSQRPSVEVAIATTPNAGGTTFFTMCAQASAIDLLTIYKPSILGPPMAGGTFVPALASGTTVFNPSLDMAGQYQYRVKSTNEQCPGDSSYIYISLIPAPDSGEDTSVNFASTDLPQDLFGMLEGTPIEGGIWSPDLVSGGSIFDPTFDPPGVYTYSVVSSETGCTSTTFVEVSITGTDKLICHKGKPRIVSAANVEQHLNHGDYLGTCTSTTVTKKDLAFYPNPGSGYYQVSGDAQEIQTIKILNSHGTVLKEYKTEDSRGINEINISELKRGIYFAQIITSEGETTKRLIKN